ncbi:hypothetical protein QYE88_42455, partial [Enterobacter hormaechei subsp. steigerwaltii]|nr:hypothetical protein [Enterobacter hormaechei subsp. steigerwaltii]
VHTVHPGANCLPGTECQAWNEKPRPEQRSDTGKPKGRNAGPHSCLSVYRCHSAVLAAVSHSTPDTQFREGSSLQDGLYARIDNISVSVDGMAGGVKNSAIAIIQGNLAQVAARKTLSASV